MACESQYDFKEVLKVINKMAAIEIFFDEEKINEDEKTFQIGQVR